MTSFKYSMFSAFFVVVVHMFLKQSQRFVLNLLGERFSLNLILAFMIAAVLTAIVWSSIKEHRDMLSLVFVGGSLLFLLVSRPVFQSRFSLFLFFILGIVTVLDEKKSVKWLPILLVFSTALICECLPSLFSQGIRFYWLDVLVATIAGLGGRLIVCNRI